MLKTLKNLFEQDKGKFVVPKSVQSVIPMKTIREDGMFLVSQTKKFGTKKYAKTDFEQTILIPTADEDGKPIEDGLNRYREEYNKLLDKATGANAMEQQRKESKEFLDVLTTRDQRMMFAVLTMVHTADTKEQPDEDTEALLTTARKKLCQFAVLKSADGWLKYGSALWGTEN